MKRRVLILDNDKDALTLISTLFEAAGAAVSQSNDPDDAVEIALGALKGGAPFDMIVTDIMMPGKNGFEVSKEIRDGGYTGPIVAFTATTSGFGRKSGDDAGISSYLSKDTLKANLIEALLDTYCPK